MTKGDFYFDACLFFKGDTLRILRPDAAPITDSFSKIDVNEKDYLKMGGSYKTAFEESENKGPNSSSE